MTQSECPLCNEVGGDLLFEDALCRIVLLGGTEGSAYPGFCRVIWQRHVREMSDLVPGEQQHLFRAVMAVERAVRNIQQPDKINLASLGNVVPHLHWHVIPRWIDDCNFPSPIWAAAQRPGSARAAADVAKFKTMLHDALKDGA